MTLRTELCGQDGPPRGCRGPQKDGGPQGRASFPFPPSPVSCLNARPLLGSPWPHPSGRGQSGDGSSCPAALGGEPESDPVGGLSISRFQHLPPGAVVEGGVWGQEEASALQAKRNVDVGAPLPAPLLDVTQGISG